MKYAILGPKKAVLQISDIEPEFVGENSTVVEVSDEIAEIVIAGKQPESRQLYFLIDGVLKTAQEHFQSLRPKVPRKQTKLQIMLRLEAMGKWTTFKAIMASMPTLVQDAWNLAQFIDESDPLFQTNRSAFLNAMGITEEQLSSLFDPN